MRGMKVGLATGAVFIATMFTASGSALAAAGDIQVTIRQLPLEVPAEPPATGTVLLTTYPVTYSTVDLFLVPKLTNYVGYEITFKSIAKNKINSVAFEGTTKVVRTGGIIPNEIAPYASAEGGWPRGCTQLPTPATPNEVTINCQLGSFLAGETKGPYVVFFKSPVLTSALGTETEVVRFSGLLLQQEGFNDVNSQNNNSRDVLPPLDVALGTNNPQKVTTTLPGSTSPADIFTGEGGAPSSIDKVVTRVTIPALPKFTTANLFEVEGVTCPPDRSLFQTCTSSSLTIPGSFNPYLKIVLRQDASTLAQPINTLPTIADVNVMYEGVKVLDCPSYGTISEPWSPLPDGVPCIQKRTDNLTGTRTQVCTTIIVPRDHGKGKDATKPDSDNTTTVVCENTGPYEVSGYFEWLIINTKNGRFNLE